MIQIVNIFQKTKKKSQVFVTPMKSIHFFNTRDKRGGMIFNFTYFLNLYFALPKIFSLVGSIAVLKILKC